MRLDLVGVMGALLTVSSMVGGCTAPNPFIEGEDGAEGSSSGSSTDPSTSGSPTGDPTTATSTSTSAEPTTSSTTDPDTTVDETDEVTGDPTTDDTSGPALCEGDALCVANPPAGWSGPVVWVDVPIAEDVACPDLFPDPAFEAFDDLQAPPAQCECSCADALNVGCADPVLEYHAGDSACVSVNTDYDISAFGSCNTSPNQSSGQYWEVQDPGVTGGSCAPMAEVSVPEASWTSRSLVCGGASLVGGACDSGETCLPTPPEGFEARVCVWQAGNLECPTGFDDGRFVRHAEIDDSRACDECTCGNPTGECNGSVVLWAESDCDYQFGASGNIDIGGGCERGITATQYSVTAAEVSNLSVSNVSCEASVGTAIGEAEPDEPFTLCCRGVD
ncbi:MAG: hypothetical protein AAGA54_20255 [Myxococcota bacterium]